MDQPRNINTASDDIRTVSLSYGYKILQLLRIQYKLMYKIIESKSFCIACKIKQ